MAYHLTRPFWKASKSLSPPQCGGTVSPWSILFLSFPWGAECKYPPWWGQCRNYKWEGLQGHSTSMYLLKSSIPLPSSGCSKNVSLSPQWKIPQPPQGICENWNQRLRALWKWIRSSFTTPQASHCTQTKNNIYWAPTPPGAFLFMKAVFRFSSLSLLFGTNVY